jgi:hypothetical protein
MKLWLISQDSNEGYDTYDSAVVCAPNEEAARFIHPGSGEFNSHPWEINYTWCKSPDQVTVKEIGLAHPSMPQGVVLASFNAG